MAKKPVSKAKPTQAGKQAKTKTSSRSARTSTTRAVKPKAPSPRREAQGAKKAVVKALGKQHAARQDARPTGMPEKIRDAALAVLDERKAEDILTFDLTGRSAMADYLIIASGRASKQLVALAHHLGEAFTKLGVSKPRLEGMQDANWVLVDAGDVIVHLFRPEVRHYYDLESVWQN